MAYLGSSRYLSCTGGWVLSLRFPHLSQNFNQEYIMSQVLAITYVTMSFETVRIERKCMAMVGPISLK